MCQFLKKLWNHIFPCEKKFEVEKTTNNVLISLFRSDEEYERYWEMVEKSESKTKKNHLIINDGLARGFNLIPCFFFSKPKFQKTSYQSVKNMLK